MAEILSLNFALMILQAIGGFISIMIGMNFGEHSEKKTLWVFGIGQMLIIGIYLLLGELKVLVL